MGFSLANWVAAVSAALMILVWIVGSMTLPDQGSRTGAPNGSNALASIVPFSPGPDFVGEHKYGLWTLYCRKAAPGPEAGVGAANPTTPDLGSALPIQAGSGVRCLTHARINVRDRAKPVTTLLAINVLTVGPDQRPFLVVQIPVRARGDGAIFFAIDENKAFKAPVGRCDEGACHIQSSLPQTALDQMLAGKDLRIRLNPEGSAKPLILSYPLHGFRESFDALKLAQPVS